MSELGDFLGNLARDREEDKQNLTGVGEQPVVPFFPIELVRVVDWNIQIVRSDTGLWCQRTFQWVTTDDFNTWTGDDAITTENNEMKVKGY